MITYPRDDIFSRYMLKTTLFRPFFRQSFSRLAGGALVTSDLGSPVWRAAYVTGKLREDDVVEFEAVLNSLDGAAQVFLATDTRRDMPRLYPSGAFADTGVVHSLGVNGKSLRVSGLPPFFRLVVGDRFSYQISGHHLLHEVQEEVVANASGLTPEFDVFPHLPTVLTASTPIRLRRPVASMRVEPESVQATIGDNLVGTVAFSAIALL